MLKAKTPNTAQLSSIEDAVRIVERGLDKPSKQDARVQITAPLLASCNDGAGLHIRKGK